MAPGDITVRDAGTAPDDVDFLVAAFDSTIPQLLKTGNGGQWGATLFSAKDGFAQETRDDVAQSQRYSATGEGQPIRMFISQVETTDCSESATSAWTDDTGRMFTSTGMVTMFEGEFSKHVTGIAALKPHAEAALKAGDFVWIVVLITDYRTGSKRAGAAAALMHKVRAHALQRGMKAVYVDCWTGGSAKLVPYYEKFGYIPIQEYIIKRSSGDDRDDWTGMLMRLDPQ